MRARLAVLPLVAAGLVLAGCGGSSKKAAVTITSGTNTKVETVSVGGSGGDCKRLADLGQKFSKALASTSAGASKDPAQAVADTAQAFEKFADEAPESVRDDFKTFADAFRHYADAIKGIHFEQGKVPSADDLKKLTEASKDFSTADLQRAEQHLTAWAKKNCKGVDFGTTSP